MSIHLKLSKAVKGSGSLELDFGFDDAGEGSWICTLSTIKLAGISTTADGLEYEMTPTHADDNGNAKSKKSNTWKCGGVECEVSDDETIRLSEVILKADAHGVYSAKAGVGANGSTVLVTPNWHE